MGVQEEGGGMVSEAQARLMEGFDLNVEGDHFGTELDKGEGIVAIAAGGVDCQVA